MTQEYTKSEHTNLEGKVAFDKHASPALAIIEVQSSTLPYSRQCSFRC